MTDEEKRQVEINSILKMAGAIEPKPQEKKPAKKTKKTEKK